jgi:ATP-dependent protease ClpP protease subunit
MPISATGAAVSAGGVGVLAYAHQDWWMNLDTLGGTLLLAGAGVAGAAHIMGRGEKSNSGDADEKSAARFSFKLLNDEALQKADIKLINELTEVELASRLPPDVTAAIKKASADEMKDLEEKEKEQREAIVKQIEEDLDAGLSVARVTQKLQPRVFVLEFDDMGGVRKPGATKRLIDQFTSSISMLLTTVSPYDEVVVKITSPGGAVTEYGLASSQLFRLRKAGIATTVCVDTVAASGGYMMACVADRSSFLSVPLPPPSPPCLSGL